MCVCVCVCVCVYIYIHTHIHSVMNTTILQLVAIYNIQLHVSALYVGHHQVVQRTYLSDYTVCVVILEGGRDLVPLPKLPHILCSCISYIATNCNIFVFMTECIYRYIHTTALYYWPHTTGMTHLKIQCGISFIHHTLGVISFLALRSFGSLNTCHAERISKCVHMVHIKMYKT